MHTEDFRLIFFDLDGTLIETAGEITDAVNDTLLRFNLPQVSESLVRNWIGHGTRELLAHAVAHTSSTAKALVDHSEAIGLMYNEFAHHYQNRCGTKSSLYPHVKAALQDLRAAGKQLMVVTNKEMRYAERVLRAHALESMFCEVIAGDSLPVKKPDPTALLKAMQRWKLRPDQCLMVGDSSIDVLTARNAGVPVWLLPYGYNMGQPIEASSPNRVIPDFSVFFNAHWSVMESAS